MLLNLSRLERNMDAEGLDAVIATGAENVTYLSGFWALPQWIRPGPQAYAVWPRADAETRSSVITSSGTLDLIADQNVWAARVARYGEFAVEVGADVENDLTSRRLAETSGSDAPSGFTWPTGRRTGVPLGTTDEARP